MTRANIVLAILVWISAFALVSSQFRVRHLTIEINRARDVAYQLESGSVTVRFWFSPDCQPLIIAERTARDRLGMDLPEGGRTQLVELSGSSAATAR